MTSDSHTEQNHPVSANRRIARNSIFMSVRMVIVLAVTLFTTRVVLKVLGVEDYGVYNVVCGFVSMFAFLSTSMANGIQRYFNYELGKNGIAGAQKVYNTALIVQLMVAVVIAVAAETFGLWYLYHKMVIPADRMVAAVWIFHLAIAGFMFSIMQVPYSAAVMAHERMDFYAVVSVLDALLKLAIALLIPHFASDRLVLYGILLSLISVVNFTLYFAYAKWHFAEIRLQRRCCKEMLLSMLGFSGWNFIGSFAGVLKEQGIDLVLNAFFGPVINAARGIAAQVNGGLQSFVQNISVPVRPQVIQSYAGGNVGRCMNLTFSVSKLSCCLIYLISVPIVLEIDFLLHVWLGDTIPEHTDAFIFIVMLVTYVNSLNSPISGVVHASGRMKRYQIVTSLVSVMCIPAAYVAMRLGCPPEVAIVMLLVFSAVSHCAALLVLKGIVDYSIRDYLKRVLLPFLLTVCCTFFIPLIPRMLMDESLVRFLTVGFVSLCCNSAGIYFLAMDSGERALVKQMIKIKKNK